MKKKLKQNNNNNKVILFQSYKKEITSSDFNTIKEYFRLIDIKVEWNKSIIKNNTILLNSKDFNKLLTNIKDSKINIKYINYLIKIFLKDINIENKISKKNIRNYEEIKDYNRKFNLKILAFDFILRIITQLTLNELKKIGITSEKKPDIFIPYSTTFGTLNLIKLIKENKPFLSDTDIDNEFIIKNKKDIITNLKKIKREKNKNYNNELIECIQKLLWIYDNTNYCANAILLNYFKLAKKINPKIQRTNINNSKDKNKNKNMNYKLKGKIAYPGNLQGIAKLIGNPQQKFEINNKEILVISETNPNLLPQMIISKGIITEKGGILCHAAIVCREIQKPCIINVKNCLQKISNGDTISIKNGIITKIKPPKKI
ncbi:MAG: PEP-utilizing enzyme [Candidatus Woesearchaeota archaeon]